MNPMKKPLSSNKIMLLLLFGLITFIIYIVYFVDPAQVVMVLTEINPIYYTAAFIAYAIYVFFSSLVWRSLLNNLSITINKRKALLFTWVGLFFEATIPQLGWSAEISRTYLYSRNSNQDAGKIAASSVGQKIFTMTFTIIALSLGLGSVLFTYKISLIMTILVGTILSLSVFALFLVYYISINPKATKKLLNWAIHLASFIRRRWNPQSFRLKAEEILIKYHGGFKDLRANPKALVQPIIYSIIGWFFEISVVFLAFLALGYPIPIDKILIVFTLTGTLQSVGVTIFGFTEIVMSTAYTILGLPIALGFSVTLLTRSVNLWFRLIVSYTALQWVGLDLLKKN
jgi:uncharacterized protein (TIRG00374 family)